MSNIASLWADLGHESHILTLKTDGEKVPLPCAHTALSPSFPTRFANSTESISWMEAHLNSFDLVVFHSAWTAMNLRLAATLRRHHRRYAIVPHGSLDRFDVQKKAILKRLLGPLFIKPFLEGSVGVICSNDRESRSLVTYGARCAVHAVPWPIPPTPTFPDRAKSRGALGLAHDDFVVLALGRIDYKKGFPVLLPAMRMLKDAGVKTRLLIVGPDSGGYSAVVWKLIEQLELSESTTIMPPVIGEQKARLFAAADCLALPSLNENFGNVIIEAMQLGLPCAISNNVYIAEDIVRAGAGLVHDYSAEATFAALRTLAMDADLRNRMGKAALVHSALYHPQALEALHESLLGNLLAAG